MNSMWPPGPATRDQNGLMFCLGWMQILRMIWWMQNLMIMIWWGQAWLYWHCHLCTCAAQMYDQPAGPLSQLQAKLWIWPFTATGGDFRL